MKLEDAIRRLRKQTAQWYPNQATYERVQLVLAELDRLQGIVTMLRGGIADLQRHVKACSQNDPPIIIPASMCAIIGAMHRAAEAGEV